jgi:hypothetical protein
MVLCKVLCNGLGGTENDKESRVNGHVQWQTSLPLETEAQGDNTRGAWPVAKTLQRCVLKTISWYFSKFDSGVGTECYKNLHDSMPFHDLSIWDFNQFLSPQLSQVALRGSVRLLSLHWHRFPLSLSKYCSLCWYVLEKFISSLQWVFSLRNFCLFVAKLAIIHWKMEKTWWSSWEYLAKSGYKPNMKCRSLIILPHYIFGYTLKTKYRNEKIFNLFFFSDFWPTENLQNHLIFESINKT